VIGQAGGHGRRGAQRAVHGTEVVDDARPEHLTAQARATLGQVARASRQGGQAGAEGSVQAFDERRVDAAQFTLTEGNQFIDALAATVHHPALDSGQHPATVLLDDLDDVQVGPGDARGATDLAAVHDGGEMLEDDFGIGSQAIHGDQHGLDAMGGAAFEGELEVVARLKMDGSVGPPGPGDLEGKAPGPVSVGTRDLVIVVDRAR